MNKLNRVVYEKYFCTDDLGEADGFFEINGGTLTFVTGWSHNDANWRGEYMDSLLRHFGVMVQPLPKKYEKKAEKLIREAFGL